MSNSRRTILILAHCAIWVGCFEPGGDTASSFSPEKACTLIGCGDHFVIEFGWGERLVGQYALEVVTPAGTTTCSYSLDHPDLFEGGVQGTCDGPDAVSLWYDDMGVGGTPTSVVVTIENVETGATVTGTFSPS